MKILFVIILVSLLIAFGVFFFARKKRHSKQKKDALQDMKRKVLSESKPVDFDNLIDSAFHAKELYKRLLIKYHPDRFATDEDLMKKATLISERLSQAKNDIKQLQEIEKEAEFELSTK